MDVSRWLAEHGLGHYADAFAKNGVAGDILRELPHARDGRVNVAVDRLKSGPTHAAQPAAAECGERSDQITRARTWRRLLVNGRTSPAHLPASTASAQASLTSTSGLSSS